MFCIHVVPKNNLAPMKNSPGMEVQARSNEIRG